MARRVIDLRQKTRRTVIRVRPYSTIAVSPAARPIAPTKPPTKKLSILIPSLTERASKLERLLSLLTKQLPSSDDVEILTEIDDRVLPSGAKRNRLLAAARGEYVAFIDDDDLVAEDYVASLLAPMVNSPDLITFNMVMFREGKPFRQRLGLNNADDHSKDKPDVKITANHLCAWRRSIATLVRFPDWLGYGDDQAWYKPLVASGAAQDEHYIDKDLYFYHFSFELTANQTNQRIMQSQLWSHGGVPCYWYQKRIVMARHPSGQVPPTYAEMVVVYDASGQEFTVKRSDLRQFTTCRIF